MRVVLCAFGSTYTQKRTVFLRCFSLNYECENLVTFIWQRAISNWRNFTKTMNKYNSTEQTHSLCRATFPRHFHIQYFIFHILYKCSLILTLNQIFQIYAYHSMSLYLFDLFQIFAAAHDYQRNVRLSHSLCVHVYGWHFNCYVSRMSTCQRSEQRLPFP